jgi:hypothetical protein
LVSADWAVEILLRLILQVELRQVAFVLLLTRIHEDRRLPVGAGLQRAVQQAEPELVRLARCAR